MATSWGIARFAVIGVLALTLSACGGGGDGDGVASLGDGAAASDGTPTPSMTEEEALQAFAECMRQNGVEDFPDPQIAEDGGIEFQAGAGDNGGPPSDEERQAIDDAMEACQDRLPSGLAGGPGGPSAEEEARFQDAMLAYARCMRDEGIDMPDPEFQDGGVSLSIPEGVDPDDPEFQAADEVCRPLMEEAMPRASQD